MGARLFRYVLPGVVTVILIGTIFVGLRIREATTSYNSAHTEAQVLQGYSQQNLFELSSDDLEQVEQHLTDLARNLGTLDDATEVPLIGGIVEKLPWAGPRYVANRQAIEVARLAAEAGRGLAALIRDARSANENVMTVDDESLARETWLRLLAERQAGVAAVAEDVARARAIEESVDRSLLTPEQRAQLDDVDQALERFEELSRSIDVTAATGTIPRAGLHTRYAVLFHDETRDCPDDKLAGDFALVELSGGVPVFYAVFDLRTLDDGYPPECVDASVARCANQPLDQFDLGNALPAGAFAEERDIFQSQYARANWPPIDGVISTLGERGIDVACPGQGDD